MSSAASPAESPDSSIVSFGVFELDMRRNELRRKGRVVPVQQQSWLLLRHLVERPGELVTREELYQAIWRDGTFVEFEFGLNSAVNRLRRALGDSATDARYIETVPKQGYRFIAPVDVRFMEAVLSEPPPEIEIAPLPEADPVTPANPKWRILLLASALAAAFLLVAVIWWMRERSTPPAPPLVYRYSIPLVSNSDLISLAISPQGNQIVSEMQENGARRLFRRFLDEDHWRPVTGGENGRAPFFSPDGSKVAFFADGALKVEDANGVRRIASVSPTLDLFNGTWGKDGYLYYEDLDGSAPAIFRIHEAGGPRERVLDSVHRERGESFVFANQLIDPARPALIYTTNQGPTRRSVELLDLHTHASSSLVEQGMGGQLLPSGHFLYYWAGKVFAAPFNLQSRTLSGTAVEVLKDVPPYRWVSGHARVSDNGTLAYLKDSLLAPRRLERIDAQGRITRLPVPEGSYEQAEMSPDGSKLLLVRRDGASLWTAWSYEFRTGDFHRLFESSVPRLRAVWSPDGKAITVALEKDNGDFANLFLAPYDHPQQLQRLTEQPDFGQFPQSWSAKANAVLFMEGVHPGTGADIMVLPMGGDRQPRSLIATPAPDRSPDLSLDTRWLVYESDGTAPGSIYVDAYDAAGYRVIGAPVKIAEGSDPLWAKDGKNIFFLAPDRTLHAVEWSGGRAVRTRQLSAGPITDLGDYWTRALSLGPDGKLLVIRSMEDSPKGEIEIVVNWFEDLKRLCPLR